MLRRIGGVTLQLERALTRELFSGLRLNLVTCRLETPSLNPGEETFDTWAVTVDGLGLAVDCSRFEVAR